MLFFGLKALEGCHNLLELLFNYQAKIFPRNNVRLFSLNIPAKIRISYFSHNFEKSRHRCSKFVHKKHHICAPLFYKIYFCTQIKNLI